jgi:cytochrome P450
MTRAAACPLHPPPALATLRDEAPIVKVRLWDGSRPWLVTRHAEQRALLADARLSHDTQRPGFPHPSLGARERQRISRTFIGMDDPEHARLREMVRAPFGIQRVEALRPAIHAIVDRQIDALLEAGPPADLVEHLALPVPSLIICGLLGVPYADHAFVQEQSAAIVDLTTSAPAARAATRALLSHLERLIAQKRARRTGDVLSDLVNARVTPGALSRHDAASMGLLLLVAGHQTTASMIALGTLALLEHPEQLAFLRDSEDPAVVATAVEELLRYLTIVHSGLRRVAVADIAVGDELIRAGDGVIMAVDAGNHDERAFPDAGALDLRRGARQHLAFGFGVHRCLGQALARVELQVVYSALLRRIPTLRRATGHDRLAFKDHGLVYGLRALPVAW